ncbi:MAG: phosphatidate cytidylyltransferase [Betaproteobacteria bacterium HGW-Betaproteobacteria-8]|nr:MAG: phosphatidate cytidylyltransferase [Betaproteobacteria bacterium HGW-Betaproteobacteria-8]
MLKTRVLTSVILMAGFLAAVFFLPDVYWALLMLAFIAIAFWEWAGIAKLAKPWRHVYVSTAIVFGVIIILADNIGMPTLQPQVMFYSILAATIFWLMVSPAWLMMRFQIRQPAVLAFIGLVILFPTWLALVSMRGISPWLLLMVMATVWIADSAAYFAGRRFGKHKLAPQISPGKTWEGVLGAWLGVSVYGAILCVSLSLPYWTIVGLLGITVLSIMGDLLESLVKRQAGVKDSGSLLPGHGGILDRIDGLTSTLPLVMFFIYFPTYFLVMESFYA